MKTNKLKLNVFLVSIAILIGLLHSCYEDETSNETNQLQQATIQLFYLI